MKLTMLGRALDRLESALASVENNPPRWIMLTFLAALALLAALMLFTAVVAP